MGVLQNLSFDTVIPQFVSLQDGKAIGLIVVDDRHQQQATQNLNQIFATLGANAPTRQMLQ